MSIGYSGVNHGSYSIALGNYSANRAHTTSAPGSMQVAIGCGNNLDSGAFGAINIGSYSATNSATSDQAIAIGQYAYANGNKSIAMGMRPSSLGSKSIAIGYQTNIHASAEDAICIGNNADANNANSLRAIAIGHDSDASHNDTIAIGFDAQSTASGSIAIGASTDSTYASAIAIGKNSQSTGGKNIAIGYSANAIQAHTTAIGLHVKSNVARVTEIGYWSDATTRGGAVTIRGETGQVSATLQDRSSAYTDGGATKGNEADNTLMREGYSVRRDGTKLFADLNVAGTISTHQLSNDSPTFTGLTTLEKVTMAPNSFMEVTGDFTLNSPHEGAIILCNNTSNMTVTVPTMSKGFSTSFIAKSSNNVSFAAASGMSLNSFGGANTIAGRFGQASLIYDCPVAAILGGNIL